MPQPVIFFDYRRVADEIIKCGFKKHDIFYYRETPLESEFQNFFFIGQTLLYLADKEIGIHPARIFFNNNITINAKAGKLNDYYLISLNAGLLVKRSTSSSLMRIFGGLE
jgi:hypothetical protein